MTSMRESIGPYRLLEELGVGGMGEVHLALDRDGRTVAVKILHPSVARDAVARRRLEREVATMRRIRSPYVAEVVDADFTVRRPYIVTRYVQGRALDARVRADGPIRPAKLPVLARGLARALHAIHTAGIVHRDLKPANVVLLDDAPVMIDFGLAHVLDATRLTRTGTAIGTPGYLAPEVLEGERSGPAADVFSWGATVAFAAHGRSPYGPGPAQAIFSRVLRARYDVTGVPRELRPLVAAALAVAPESRPGTADLLEALALLGRPAARPVPRTDVAGGATGPRARTAKAAARAIGSSTVPAGPAAEGAQSAGTKEPGAPVAEVAAYPAGRVRPAGGVRPGERVPLPPVAGGAEDARREPEVGGSRAAGASTLLMVARLLRTMLALAIPTACYALPVFALAITLSVGGAGYAWDSLARAHRRMVGARTGRLARLRIGLVSLVAVPVQTVLRLAALVAAMIVGYAVVLAVTWWTVVPQGRALALPLGFLAAAAGIIRAWYAADRRAARLVVAVLAAAILVPAVLGIPFPLWWPVVAP